MNDVPSIGRFGAAARVCVGAGADPDGVVGDSDGVNALEELGSCRYHSPQCQWSLRPGSEIAYYLC